MKFLDSKNRLFGKIHILYVFGVVSLLFVIILFLQAINTNPDYVTVRVKGSPGNWWWVTPRPPDWLASAIHIGDKEYDALGKTAAEVLDVQVYDAGGSTKDVYLTIKLAARLNKRTQKYRYKGEPVEIGGPIVFNIGNAFFPGMVTAIEGENGLETKHYNAFVTVKLYDHYPWEYDAIIPGETMLDGSGNAIAEIIDKQQFPAEKEVSTLDGRIVKAYSPVKNDFILNVKLKVINRGGEYVFREEQYVKVGNMLWIQFPSYNLSKAHVLSFRIDNASE